MLPRIILCLGLALATVAPAGPASGTLKQAEVRRYDTAPTANEVCDPGGLIMSGHTLYGTASGGHGAVFKVNTDGSGYTLLHGFNAVRSAARTNSDGNYPRGLVLSGDTLFGVAQAGGAAGFGAVFKIKTNGRDFTVLHQFTGPDGAVPWAGMVLSGQTLFGTTQRGGRADSGTVFKLGTDGASFTLLHDFTAKARRETTSGSGNFYYPNNDGAHPMSAPVLSGKTLYGLASYGGNGGCGTAFKIDTDGSNFTVLHQFAPGSIAENPHRFTNDDGAELSGLVVVGNTLYGTAASGGVKGGGTLFQLGADGSDFTVLKAFVPNSIGTKSEGGNPGGLQLVGSTLYGKPGEDLAFSSATEFRINLDGSGFTAFPIGLDAEPSGPLSSLLVSGDTIYGTTLYGGKAGGGLVFQVNANGTRFKIIHPFTEKWRLQQWPGAMTD